MSPVIDALEGGGLAWLRAVFKDWELVFSGSQVAGVPAQLEGVVAAYDQLARTTGDAELATQAMDALRAGLRRESVSAECKSLVQGLLWHLLRTNREGKPRTITAVAARAWRDNVRATKRAACSGCGFVVPVTPGQMNWEIRKRAPDLPCLERCPECGGEFGEADGD